MLIIVSLFLDFKLWPNDYIASLHVIIDISLIIIPGAVIKHTFLNYLSKGPMY